MRICIYANIYSMYDEPKHSLAIVCIAVLLLFVLYVISSDCTICTIMQNPPDWIDSWYDGEDRWNVPEKGPAG